jgi:hypothetical protein
MQLSRRYSRPPHTPTEYSKSFIGAHIALKWCQF